MPKPSYAQRATEKRAALIAELNKTAENFEWFHYKGKRYGTLTMLSECFGNHYGSVARQTRAYGVAKAPVDGAALWDVDSYIRSAERGARPAKVKTQSK
jgi:hypothetical protein